MNEADKGLKKLLDNFPDFETFKKNLLKLRNYNFNNLSDSDFRSIIVGNTIVQPFFSGILSSEVFNTHTFYRVRNIKPTTEDISLIRTFSYPSPSQCHQNGRANRKNKSVFYASDYAISAMLESKPNDGEIGFLSIWKPNVRRDIQCAMYLPKSIKKENFWYNKTIELHEFLENESVALGRDKNKYIDYLNNFFCDQFVLEESPYHLTSWVANEALYNNLGNDFILYPSYLTNSNFCNFAFHPNFIDTNMSLEKILQFRIEVKAETNWNYSIGSVGELKGNIITWRAPSSEEVVVFPGIIEEGIEK